MRLSFKCDVIYTFSIAFPLPLLLGKKNQRMKNRNPLKWRNLLFWLLTHIWIPGGGWVEGQDVTLDSIEIFTKHEWFRLKPTIYFQCKGENKTVLPDVTTTHVLYTFRPEESWQPLTEIHSEKCKRCGFYEEGSVISDNQLDEWEFCPSDFSPDQVYVHVKDNEMNATFSCHGCTQFSSGSKATSSSGSQEEEGNKIKLVIVIVIAVSVAAATVILIGIISVIKYSQRKKRQQDQARFMKLFEEGEDELEELGLETVI
ncbi:PREDICTED: uncharacterized protein LOC104816298 isoform X2 [Tarenaya hassleriana]|uniref:uncharacterized protein LOC104816298 isoform X2 n=1 Tax=Tarenaya hassleriana TaxID=28532 RepID=UPI00053C26B9|nr:PREDICTED: uncharacterized protein LOC104816298 isoform X2 [Tarenaya hassleriana]